MDIKIDATDIDNIVTRLQQLDVEVRNAVMDNLVEAALFALGKIVIWMPKDTGSAANSWGTPGLGGSWEIDESKLQVTMGGLHYIEYLNEGHSKQAPSGFVDAIMQRAMDAFAAGLAKAQVF